MPKNLNVPDEPFAPLVLSPDEQAHVLSVTDELVAETLLAFEDFVSHGRALDAQYWEFLRAKDNMSLYRTREELHHGLLPNGALIGRDYFHQDSVLEEYRPPNVPLAISTGFIDGTVEDAAFGSLADNEHRALLRNSYIFPAYKRKILLTLQSPTEEDPFRFVCMKWTVRPFANSEEFQGRDLVFAESSGLAVDSNGERVHYFLMHTLDCFVDKLPELTEWKIQRSIGSVCFIYRQFDRSTLEVFCRTYMNDPPKKTDALASPTAKLYAESIVSPHTVVECSYVKKLMWLMLQKAAMLPPTDDSEEEKLPTQCELCKKSWSDTECEDKEALNESVDAMGYKCRVCRRICCSACSISKQISVDSGGEEEDEDLGPVAHHHRRATGCCVACVLEAKNLSAWDVAMATLAVTKAA